MVFFLLSFNDWQGERISPSIPGGCFSLRVFLIKTVSNEENGLNEAGNPKTSLKKPR